MSGSALKAVRQWKVWSKSNMAGRCRMRLDQ
jgi:hypothetical protein